MKKLAAAQQFVFSIQTPPLKKVLNPDFGCKRHPEKKLPVGKFLEAADLHPNRLGEHADFWFKSFSPPITRRLDLLAGVVCRLKRFTVSRRHWKLLIESVYPKLPKFDRFWSSEVSPHMSPYFSYEILVPSMLEVFSENVKWKCAIRNGFPVDYHSPIDFHQDYFNPLQHLPRMTLIFRFEFIRIHSIFEQFTTWISHFHDLWKQPID